MPSGTITADGNTALDVQGYGSTGLANSLYLSGTFSTATVKLQLSPNGSTWFDVPSASWTAATIYLLTHRFALARLVTSGGGTPSINWAIL